jgi:hypothetical protein
MLRRGNAIRTRPPLCRLFGAALLAIDLAAASSARSASPDFAFSWDAPASCPDESAVRRQIDALLEEAPPVSVRLTARAAVSRDDEAGAWIVRLFTDRDGVPGERTIEAESCGALADATALIVALTLDPTHVRPVPPVRTPTPSGTTAPTTPPTSPPLPRVERARVPPVRPPLIPEEARRWELHGAALAEVGLDVGTLPKFAYGFTAAGAVLYGPLRGEVDLFDGGLRGCYSPLILQSAELGPCGGVELGAIHGSGSGPTFKPSSPSPTGFWAALTLGARLTIRVTRRLGLALDVGAVFPLYLGAFQVPGTTFFQPGAAEGRVHLGPELRF